MTINERIRKAVSPVLRVCEPIFYEGTEKVYGVFFVSEDPEGFEDGMPTGSRASVTLHLYAPRHMNTVAIRRNLRQAIAAADDFTAPSVLDDSDGEGQHWIYSFEVLEVGW